MEMRIILYASGSNENGVDVFPYTAEKEYDHIAQFAEEFWTIYESDRRNKIVVIRTHQSKVLYEYAGKRMTAPISEKLEFTKIGSFNQAGTKSDVAKRLW